MCADENVSGLPSVIGNASSGPFSYGRRLVFGAVSFSTGSSRIVPAGSAGVNSAHFPIIKQLRAVFGAKAECSAEITSSSAGKLLSKTPASRIFRPEGVQYEQPWVQPTVI